MLSFTLAVPWQRLVYGGSCVEGQQASSVAGADIIWCRRRSEMNKHEALAVLEQTLSRWRRFSYSELAKRIGAPETFEATVGSAARYQVEVEAFWDDQPQGNIRVIGAVDDGGIRAFLPLTADFIMRPDGSLLE